MTRTKNKKPPTQSLRQRNWEKQEPLYYEDWIRLANEFPDQDRVWREHELHARSNYQNRMQVELDRPWDLSELGGES